MKTRHLKCKLTHKMSHKVLNISKISYLVPMSFFSFFDLMELGVAGKEYYVYKCLHCGISWSIKKHKSWGLGQVWN